MPGPSHDSRTYHGQSVYNPDSLMTCSDASSSSPRSHPLLGIDLFAGAGGLSLGARAAGLRVGLAIESDPHAARTYTANHPDTTVLDTDIRFLNPTSLRASTRTRDHLVVFGAPPCQGFSWSNVRTRNIANPLNWLFEEFLKVVAVVRPAWLLFENVQGLATTARGFFFSHIKDRLSEHYLLYHAVLNAMDYGVPQNRSRFFLVGSRDGLPFTFPSKHHESPLTVDDAIRDLPSLSNGAAQCSHPYEPTSPSHYGRSMRGFRSRCCNHLVTQNSTLVLSRYRYIPQGGNWENIPVTLMQNYTAPDRCHTGLYYRLRSDQPSIVIGNYRKNMLIHPTQHRGLSVREAARIQSFPDWYRFCGSIGFQQQQVGNAVPPLLARSVFRAILRSNSQ